jgi:hypothetical protein
VCCVEFYLYVLFFSNGMIHRKGSSGTAVKLLPCDHEVMGWKQPLAEMQGNAVYIRPKVVGPFSGPYASGSYVHRTAPLIEIE